MTHNPQEVQVFCHSDYAYGERPTGLRWGKAQLEIVEVLNRWRSPIGLHFLVQVNDGRVFELAYTGEADIWDVVLRT